MPRRSASADFQQLIRAVLARPPPVWRCYVPSSPPTNCGILRAETSLEVFHVKTFARLPAWTTR